MTTPSSTSDPVDAPGGPPPRLTLGARRPALVSWGWTLRDYAKRVWDNSGEDNVLFLAGGIAFNLLLAAVPFVMLIITGITWFLNKSAAEAGQTAVAFIDQLLPAHQESPDAFYHKAIADIVTANKSLGIYSAVGFVWFSTRLFGSLRTVLASVFDIEQERGIIQGKIFDIKVTVVAMLLVVANTLLSAYLALATTRGVHVLGRIGLRSDVMGGLEYWLGRLLAFAIIAVMFFALYKFLPIRRVRAATAWVAALFTSLAFEGAKTAFAFYVQSFNPGSYYTGTLAALAIIVVWVYYAALIFILGGEVAQVYELRRVRRRQREVFV